MEVQSLNSNISYTDHFLKSCMNISGTDLFRRALLRKYQIPSLISVNTVVRRAAVHVMCSQNDTLIS